MVNSHTRDNSFQIVTSKKDALLTFPALVPPTTHFTASQLT